MGPNTGLGGLKAGLFRPACQVATLEAVARPPMAPIASVMPIETNAEIRPFRAPGTADRVVSFEPHSQLFAEQGS